MDKKIAVLIPCYNEAITIKKVVEDYKQALPNADIYVFDNNSTDGSADIAQEAGALIRHTYRQGKGFVIHEMFRDIDADVYLMVDGDDACNPEDAIALMTPVLEGGADMVTGDRLSSTYFTANTRRFHNAGNRLVRFLVNFLFKSRVRDIMSGTRAFSRHFVYSFPVMSGGFEIETEMTIHALDKKMLTAEMPINFRDRPPGSVSKLNTFRDGFKVLKTIFILFKDYRPMAFFGIFSVLTLLASIGLVIPVLIDYFVTGQVPRFPTLIVSVGFGILTVLSFAIGCILDTIKKYNDRNQLMLTKVMMKNIQK